MGGLGAGGHAAEVHLFGRVGGQVVVGESRRPAPTGPRAAGGPRSRASTGSVHAPSRQRAAHAGAWQRARERHVLARGSAPARGRPRPRAPPARRSPRCRGPSTSVVAGSSAWPSARIQAPMPPMPDSSQPQMSTTTSRPAGRSRGQPAGHEPARRPRRWRCRWRRARWRLRAWSSAADAPTARTPGAPRSTRRRRRSAGRPPTAPQDERQLGQQRQRRASPRPRGRRVAGGEQARIPHQPVRAASWWATSTRVRRALAARRRAGRSRSRPRPRAAARRDHWARPAVVELERRERGGGQQAPAAPQGREQARGEVERPARSAKVPW